MYNKEYVMKWEEVPECWLISHTIDELLDQEIEDRETDEGRISPSDVVS